MEIIKTIISSYKLNGELVFFLKYAGLCLTVMRTNNFERHFFLDSKDVVIQCIGLLKKIGAKKVKNYLSKNVHDSFLRCPCCCPETVARESDWSTNAETRDIMEKEGKNYVCKTNIEWYGEYGIRT